MPKLSIDTGTDELLCEIDDRVATITLNRPEARNALSDQLTPALRRTIKQCGDDANIGSVLITGAGNAFCAGGDVKGSVPGSELREVAFALAKALSEGPPIVFGRIKDNLDNALKSDLLGSMDYDAENLVRSARTNDHKEAVRAFIEKRKPTFVGN